MEDKITRLGSPFPAGTREEAISTYFQGVPVSIILKQFGVSRWGFYLWLKKENKVTDRRKTINYKLVRELRRSGLLFSEIAKQLGCSESGCYLIARDITLTKPEVVECKTCGKIKQFTSAYFRVCNKLPFGLRRQCRVCHNAYMRKYSKKFRKESYEVRSEMPDL